MLLSALRADRKYVVAAGRLVQAGAGSYELPLADQERMYALCERWMAKWRQFAAATRNSALLADGAAPITGATPPKAGGSTSTSGRTPRRRGQSRTLVRG